MNKNPGDAIRELYAALWHFAAGARGQLLGATALLASSQLIRLTLPYLAGQAINALQRNEFGAAGRWIATLAGVYVGAWALHGPGRILERNVGVKVREAVADRLYARIAAAPLVWHDSHHSGAGHCPILRRTSSSGSRMPSTSSGRWSPLRCCRAPAGSPPWAAMCSSPSSSFRSTRR
jgi:ABC-type multidrug transport system fused ATPase/permease subunit